MNIIEKLKILNSDEDYFDPYFLMDILGWPKIPAYMDYDEDGIPVPEENPDMEELDLENFEFVEIDDRHLIMNCGGDWQNPYEVRIELNSDDELEIKSYKLTEDYGKKDSINIEELLDIKNNV